MVSARTPQSPPVIKPVVGDVQRPLWSVMIPSYNCSIYLKETLKSVLAQAKDPGKMQIIVVDDCSTDDDVEAIVNEIGKGRVGFFRQPQNVGSLRNFETCINLSSGKLIHILHGDDLVKPGFYDEIESLFVDYPEAGAAFTGLLEMNEQGNPIKPFRLVQNHAGIIEDWLLKIAKNQSTQVCATVVKRTVYEEIGSFYAVHYGEDWEMWARIASKFPVAYSPKTLASYRFHGTNISAKSLVTGQNIRDIKTVIGIIQHYLPENRRREVKKIASYNFANYFMQNALKIYELGQNKAIALKQARGALTLHFNRHFLRVLLVIYARVVKDYFKRVK